MSTSRLEVRNLGKRYGQRHVLGGVSLDVNTSSIVGLIGPNGAGKSTLFKVLMGLVPADSGTAVLDGADLLAAPLHAKAALGLGYLPQDSCSFPELSVTDNLLALLELQPLHAAERRARLAELLQIAGLGSFENRRYETLSGGEARRVEIAKTLIGNPRFLLLDEPFSALDPRSIEELAELLRSMTKRGLGILLSDHNVHVAFRYLDRAYFLADGLVQIEGTPAAVAADPEVRRLYLGDNFPDAP